MELLGEERVIWDGSAVRGSLVCLPWLRMRGMVGERRHSNQLILLPASVQRGRAHLFDQVDCGVPEHRTQSHLWVRSILFSLRLHQLLYPQT